MRAINKLAVAHKCGGKSRATIDRWANNPRYAHLGFPKPFRISGSTVWDEADVDRWLESRKNASDQAERAA